MELAANTAISLLLATATPKFDPERGRRMSEENVVMARRLGDRRAEARALWNIVVANVYGGGDAERAVEAGESSLAIARELGERMEGRLNVVSSKGFTAFILELPLARRAPVPSPQEPDEAPSGAAA
jgi:hypothetical protein